MSFLYEVVAIGTFIDNWSCRILVKFVGYILISCSHIADKLTLGHGELCYVNLVRIHFERKIVFISRIVILRNIRLRYLKRSFLWYGLAIFYSSLIAITFVV